MDRLLTVVVGRRHQCAGATSAFSPYIISVVIGRRCLRAGAISAISLTSSSFLGVVRHGICGLFEWSSIDRLTSARSLGQASAGARRPSFHHQEDCHGQALWELAGATSIFQHHIFITHHHFFSRSYDIGSAFSAVRAGLASWSSPHFLSSSFRHIDLFQA